MLSVFRLINLKLQPGFFEQLVYHMEGDLVMALAHTLEDAAGVAFGPIRCDHGAEDRFDVQPTTDSTDETLNLRHNLLVSAGYANGIEIRIMCAIVLFLQF